VRNPPKEALKPITGGRLSGYTDINPMWRIKALTEEFGPCGIGWKYEITKQWLEEGGNDEIGAFTNINLYIKVDGEWSEAIPGTGGSMYVAKERSGLYTSDEAYKMALTDAISVACKALGFAADIYWDSDRSKYDQPQDRPKTQAKEQSTTDTISQAQAKRMFAIAKGNNDIIRDILTTFGYQNSTDVEKSKYKQICELIEEAVNVKEDKLPWEVE
jgi:hypothetical protein